MHKLYILLLATLFTNISVSLASNTPDSIGVENNKGKKVIIYKVEPKETYYSIAKKYNVPYKEVMEFNDSQLLQIGVTLKIPTLLPYTATSPSKITPSGNFIEYTIKAKDNLNSLANKYETTVDEIKRINQLSSINLQIGQILKIPTGKEQIVAENTPTVASKKIEKPISPVVETINNPEIESGTTISYTIKAKDNLNALAEKYGTTVDAIKKLNNLRSINLQIGQVLKIATSNGVTDDVPQETTTQPIANTQPIPKTSVPNTTKSDGSFEHTVATGETIYSIAKKYSLTTYQLTNANNLTGSELTVGQKLIIKGGSKSVANTATEEETDNGETMKDPKLKQPSKFGLVQFNEKGIAIWIEDKDLDPAKMLVLHRTAPVGTIIRITNPVTNRSAFAKVVGKFTENETTKDVIIVLTKAVADAIGALDKRFICNLNYGAVDNEQQ